MISNIDKGQRAYKLMHFNGLVEVRLSVAIGKQVTARQSPCHFFLIRASSCAISFAFASLFTSSSSVFHKSNPTR